METMEQVLRSHAEKYPLMEPKDAVKLIYQNVFGGGHLIRDPEACGAALRREYPEAKLILQVHDELIVECPEAIAPQVAELVSREMEQVATLNVPLTAEAKWGKSWYDAK